MKMLRYVETTRKTVGVKHIGGQYPLKENREDSPLPERFIGFAEKEADDLPTYVSRSREVLSVIGASSAIFL